MTCDLTSFSTVFQSYQNDGRMKMKGCLKWICYITTLSLFHALFSVFYNNFFIQQTQLFSIIQCKTYNYMAIFFWFVLITSHAGNQTGQFSICYCHNLQVFTRTCHLLNIVIIVQNKWLIDCLDHICYSGDMRSETSYLIAEKDVHTCYSLKNFP